MTLEHLGAAAAVVVTTVVVTLAARQRPGHWVGVLCRVLALALLASEPVYWLEQVLRQTWVASRDLPLQLSDAAVFVAAAALWWRTPLLVELTYFWGLGAVLQAVLTPDLVQHFPDLDFLLFYVSHGAVILAALLLTVGLRIAPRPGAPWRIFAVTLVYAGLVGLVDLVTNSNFMYLRARPASGSLLNFLGPWPWYIGGGLVLAALVVALLNAPFWIARRRRRTSTGATFLAMLCT